MERRTHSLTGRTPQAPPPPRAVERIRTTRGFAVRPSFGNLLPLPKVLSTPSIKESAPDLGVVGSVIESVVPSYGSDIGAVLPVAVPQPAPKIHKEPVPTPIRISTGAAEASLVRKVVPQYPALARKVRVQGTVEFTAVISKNGNIERLQLLRGHPMLVKAAEEAILQWKYRPTILNGAPVEVVTNIVVNFTLSN